MKYVLIICFSFLIAASNIGQTNDLESCKKFTDQLGDSIATMFRIHDYKPFQYYNSLIESWKNACGTSEPILRIEILNSMLEGKPTDSLIQLYYANDYQVIFTNRVTDASKLNYGFFYDNNQSYYSYLYLRSEFDSVSRQIAENLLDDPSLNKDEKLNCLLFSEDLNAYFNLLGKQEYYDSNTSKTLRKGRYRYQWPFYFKIVVGVWSPIGENTVFSTSPKIGAHIGSFISSKFSFDLGANVRIMVNDGDYDFLLQPDTLKANAATSLFLGLNFYYTMIQHQKLKLLPSLGFGLESVGTGIMKEERSNNNEDNFHRVSTLHLKGGLNISYDLFKNDELILGIYYHYAPYQLDDKLLTEFTEHALSCELQYRF